MSDRNFITLCPHCATQFRVTPGQLKVAQGQVRCGACLCVFHAEQHRKDPAPVQVQKPLSPAATAKLKAAQTNEPTPINKEPLAKTPKPKLSISTHDENLSTPIFSSQPTATVAAIKEKTESTSQTTPVETQTHLSATKIDKARQATKNQTTKNQHTEPFKAERDDTNHPQIDIPTLDIVAEPVVLHQTSVDRTPISLGGLIACLIALLLLATQYLWFNRAELYYTPTGKALLAPLCEKIPCDIAPLQQIDAIATQALTITPHNSVEGAINVTFILENTADFIQPFPAFTLSFSDLKGLTVAQRTFQPQEYINLASHDPLKMSSNRPLQFTLEIMAPPTRANSYELELLAPDL